MRVGTWNLQQAVPPGPRALAQRRAMQDLDADIWLLTEAHLDVALTGQSIHHSTQRHIKPKQRWSAISSRWPLTPLDSPHEGLALAHVSGPDLPLLVACSVMPWRSAGTSWPGEPTAKHGMRFAESLQAHAEAIAAAHDESLMLIWGGDFNQALQGRETAGSLAGRAMLLATFASLRLTPVTGHLSHRIKGIATIDHLAVPAATVAEAQMVTPTSAEGKPLSDHACYLVDF